MADVKYSKAIERLDEIISKIESDDIDVDELSLRVKEAVNLIKLCKARSTRLRWKSSRLLRISTKNRETDKLWLFYIQPSLF